MFERFTDRARRSLVLAQSEAQNLNHHFIGTEHILLGLLAEGSGVAAVALNELGLTLERAREIVVEVIGAPASGSMDKPPFTPRAKKIMELALREALQLGHNYIGTEHLLLAIIREGSGVGAQLLVKENIPLDTAREAVMVRLPPRAEGISYAPKPAPWVRAAANITPTAIRLARETPGGIRLLSTHHYLLALFEDPNSMAARALARLGVTKQQANEAVSRLDINQTSDAPPTPQQSSAPVEFDLGPGITVRITDRDLAQRLIENTGGWDQLRTRLQQFSRDVRAQTEDLSEPPEPEADAVD